jgi:hypothetical protein
MAYFQMMKAMEHSKRLICSVVSWLQLTKRSKNSRNDGRKISFGRRRGTKDRLNMMKPTSLTRKSWLEMQKKGKKRGSRKKSSLLKTERNGNRKCIKIKVVGLKT